MPIAKCQRCHSLQCMATNEWWWRAMTQIEFCCCLWRHMECDAVAYLNAPAASLNERKATECRAHVCDYFIIIVECIIAWAWVMHDAPHVRQSKVHAMKLKSSIGSLCHLRNGIDAERIRFSARRLQLQKSFDEMPWQKRNTRSSRSFSFHEFKSHYKLVYQKINLPRSIF